MTSALQPAPGGRPIPPLLAAAAVAVPLSTIGGVGMWSVVVALPAVQAEFGVDRGAASLPYTLTMLGFAAGGVVMGRLADRFGVAGPIVVGALALGARLRRRRLSPTPVAVRARARRADRLPAAPRPSGR